MAKRKSNKFRLETRESDKLGLELKEKYNVNQERRVAYVTDK